MSWFQVFLRQEGRTYQPGEVIFERGDPASCMYVVAEGEVDLAIGGAHLETLGPADIFGELALITGEARSAVARARTACRLVEIPEARFTYLVQETPHFALAVMRVLTARLRRRDPSA
jgi:CRP/FNR family transcriptional regulator, cyclic AMP receptor protein